MCMQHRFAPCGPRRLSPGFAIPLALALLCLAAGCGKTNHPPLGRVAGMVTLDGVPLPAALVVFTPQGSGRSAMATTDTGGRYELAYLRDLEGANVGNHTVRIATAGDGGGAKETLPQRYYAKTELTARVEPGSNTLDFSLQSK